MTYEKKNGWQIQTVSRPSGVSDEAIKAAGEKAAGPIKVYRDWTFSGIMQGHPTKKKNISADQVLRINCWSPIGWRCCGRVLSSA